MFPHLTVQRMQRLFRIALVAWLFYGLVARAATYYVDADSGDDARSGTAVDQAWKSLERANRQVLQPGDQLLFRAGTRYCGQLKPQGSGAVRDGKLEPIVIGQFGQGPRPRIDGEGA